MNKFRLKYLNFAEVFDAYRIVPRIILLAYGYFVYVMYTWYKSLEVQYTNICDQYLVETLKNDYTLQELKSVACNNILAYGGPTTEQTMFVTAIIGLATAIFAFYVNSGRKWDKS